MEATALENLVQHFSKLFRLVPRQAEAFGIPSTLQEVIQQISTQCNEVVEGLSRFTVQSPSLGSPSSGYSNEVLAKLKFLKDHADFLLSLLEDWQSWAKVNPNQVELFQVLENLSCLSLFSDYCPINESPSQPDVDNIIFMVAVTADRLLKEDLNDSDRIRAITRPAIDQMNSMIKLKSSLHKYKNVDQVPYAIDRGGVAFRGSNALVHKASNKKTKALVAIKAVSDPDIVRAEREVRILRLCHHPHVISLVEAYQLSGDGTIYLVTSPWAPYTVYDFISQPDPKRASSCPWFATNIAQSDRYILDVLVGIAKGVEYLHSLSIKHKDLKPDNILLHQPDPFTVQPIVADVGHSKIYKLGGPTNFIQSTLSYLAPEQLDKVESSFRSDIWQLGCCFAMILVVSRGGRAAEQELWDSFSEASCIIAQEQGSFMRTFERICSHGRLAQQLTWRLITLMLETNPSSRISIDDVLERLYSIIALP